MYHALSEWEGTGGAETRSAAGRAVAIAMTIAMNRDLIIYLL